MEPSPISVTRGETTTVMDVAIVYGCRMEDSWRLKMLKYGTRENENVIRGWVKSNSVLKHLPVISWKEFMHGLSGRGLRRMGLSPQDISNLCLLTIQGSLKCYDLYQRGT